MKAKVLIVDDDPMICQLLDRLLTLGGYIVNVAYDGLDAVAATKNIKPDLIVMDYMMPKLDGLAACEQILSTSDTADVPIIMFSAHSNPLIAQKACDIGAKLFLNKTTSMPTGLLDAIERLLVEYPSTQHISS
jgi:CheY-like chemotaxis protein